jgi:hypothetical protein
VTLNFSHVQPPYLSLSKCRTMPKRKAESSGGLSTASNRRSSRRKTSNEDKLVPKKTTTFNRPQNETKPPKLNKGKDAKTEAMRVEDTNTPQVALFSTFELILEKALVHVQTLRYHLSFASRDFSVIFPSIFQADQDADTHCMIHRLVRASIQLPSFLTEMPLRHNDSGL